VKMALDSLGYRYGHTTVWQMVALYKQAHPRPKPPPHMPRAEEHPLPTTAPHQVWSIDVRYLVKSDAEQSEAASSTRRLRPRGPGQSGGS
jgi:transposase InsO family protein